MKKADVVTFFDRLAEAIPIPKGELEYINPYTLLVAVVLSAQATDVGVNRATRPLFEKVRTPEKMLALGEAKLKDYIKSIGLYNSKAKNIIALSRILAEQHASQVPPSREVLETPAGGRPQDRQRGPQHRLRRAHHRGRHPHFPGRQPNRPGAGEDPARGRTRSGKGGAEAPQAARPSLADPARPPRLQGAQARLSGLRGPRPLRL